MSRSIYFSIYACGLPQDDKTGTDFLFSIMGIFAMRSIIGMLFITGELMDLSSAVQTKYLIHYTNIKHLASFNLMLLTYLLRKAHRSGKLCYC